MLTADDRDEFDRMEADLQTRELARIEAANKQRELQLRWLQGPESAAPSPWHQRFDEAVVSIAAPLAGFGDRLITVCRRDPVGKFGPACLLGFVYPILAPDAVFLVEWSQALDPVRRCATLLHEVRHLAVGVPSETFTRECLEDDATDFSRRLTPTVLAAALAAVGPGPSP